MDIKTLYRDTPPSTLATVALLTAALGFGGGWLAHRGAASRTMRPYRAPVRPVATAPATCASELAAAEVECPGASQFLVPRAPRGYRIERSTLKCMMSSSKLESLRAAPSYEPYSFRGKPSGIRVFNVKPCSLAARIGLQSGDIIMTVDSRVVNNEEDLAAAYQRLGSGNYASVVYKRGAELNSLVFYLGPNK